MKDSELKMVMAEYDIFDGALLSHGYTVYMRDYELIIENHVGPAPRGMYSYLFTCCVEAHVHTSLTSEGYRSSLDDRLLDHKAGNRLDGFVWGTNWALLEDWHLTNNAQAATIWSEQLEIDMHEAVIKSNAHIITLIFSSLTIRKLTDEVDSHIAGAFIPLR